MKFTGVTQITAIACAENSPTPAETSALSRMRFAASAARLTTKKRAAWKPASA